ncbi:DeoR/GlpR transcriptional regulator [Ruficoccus amylovorans]|uniref:DeoR/GlpR transcriptional regulator n=1 Tax=Ruficoccus amylovorans TaxID=1804625 RepID=A0A842HL89_9BACT|nr:DeoR/GlpR family DNA-binding transcription regulator [Ruficoccus amylovorans]MBC2595901.1 DeoR/GlpR transcriptional regulator [Ruficoccus amylovorans]
MLKFERTQAILRAIQQNGSVSLSELVEELHHSEATIRRDLAELEREGKLIRTHGGAILPQRLALEPSYDEKRSCNWPFKKQIADCVLKAIPEGVTIYLDAGTTCLEAGIRLLERNANPIFTNSIPLLVASCNYPGTVTAVGGEVRSISRALVGAMSLNWLDKLYFDIVLIGASAIRDDGAVLTTEIHEASLKAHVIEHADKAFLLADSDKLTASATLEFTTLKQLSAWYTDHRLDRSKFARLRKNCSATIIRTPQPS